MGVAASAAPLAGQLAGCRWALWLGWGRGFLSSVVGFRQFVKFFEVYEPVYAASFSRYH